jgi:hypothetical protein
MAFATAPILTGDVSSKPALVDEFVGFLNQNYDSLSARVIADLNQPGVKSMVMIQLRMLENYLRGEQPLPPNSLTGIACARPVCDGGDGGSCRMCNYDGDRIVSPY